MIIMEKDKYRVWYTGFRMSDDIKEILNHLISAPKESQILVDFDLKRKFFLLSVPIYVAQTVLPRSVREYVEARKGRLFKPHLTSFQFEGGRIVKLVQEIPFRWGFDPGSRQEIVQFSPFSQAGATGCSTRSPSRKNTKTPSILTPI